MESFVGTKPKTLSYRTKKSLGSDTVDEAWDELESWFRKHMPHVYRALNPGVSASDLSAFEKELKHPLPDSFKASYERHDGHDPHVASGLLLGLPLLPLRVIRRLHRDWRKGAGKTKKDHAGVSCFPYQKVQPVFSSPSWFPISDDNDGNHIAIDLAPGPTGSIGQVIVCGRYKLFHPVLALDFAQLLSDIAEELTRGNWKLEAFDGSDEYLGLAAPDASYLTDIGAIWSRHKLGLRRLSKNDLGLWDRHKNQ